MWALYSKTSGNWAGELINCPSYGTKDTFLNASDRSSSKKEDASDE